MRILITGGFGFVGGRLAQHLHQNGCEVLLGTRSACPSPDWLFQAEVVQTNWRDGRSLEAICAEVDVVIQAAGMNAKDCARSPVEALEVNGLATARLLESACRVGVKKFVYLSTAHVYSGSLSGRLTEDACPRNRHPYATSHVAGENSVLGAYERGETEGVVVRLSNAFGAPAHRGVSCWMLLANDLCRQVVQTQKMVLYSSGSQQRDFLAMTEACHAIGGLATSDLDIGGTGIFNVGAGVSLSVLEMAVIIQHRCEVILGFEPEIQRPITARDEQKEPLYFESKYLPQKTKEIMQRNIDEIDSLLVYCQAEFSHNRSTVA